MSHAISRSEAAAAKSEQAQRQGAQGRRSRAKAAVKRALTVGDLIAAAYDALGSEARDVVQVLASPNLSAALHRRIVLV